MNHEQRTQWAISTENRAHEAAHSSRPSDAARLYRLAAVGYQSIGHTMSSFACFALSDNLAKESK